MRGAADDLDAEARERQHRMDVAFIRAVVKDHGQPSRRPKVDYAVLAEGVRAAVAAWNEDARAEWHERAGMLEDSGMTRERADCLAFWRMRAEWARKMRG